mgnify:CR=1 FL=1
MYDNMNSDGKQIEIGEVDDNSNIVLSEMIQDFEEKLYAVRIQLKSYINQLEIKEQEKFKKEQAKDNRNLFSPIYSEDKEEDNEIENLKIEISKLRQQEDYIGKRIYALNYAIQCINRYSDSIKNIEEKGRRRINDQGLSILEAQEIERQRIARDLHDTTVQNLTSMVHKAELCIKLIDIDTIRAKLELHTMSNTLKSVINDMRGIIYNLKPMTIEDLGLTVTVQRYANKLMDLNNIDIFVEANEEPEEILQVIKVTVFRVIQEACTNILKHANASVIDIKILYEEDYLRITVKDNGKGFNSDIFLLNNSEQTSSFGLSIMRERISLLSGSLEIQSEKGKGTTIIINVPLTKQEEEKNE